MRRVAIVVAIVAVGVTLAGQQPPRLQKPRVEPLPAASWGDRERTLAARYGTDGRLTNDLATLLRHPGAFEGIVPFTRYVTTASTLPARDRELLILRTAWLCRSESLWAQHAPAARQAGLSAADIRRIAEGPAAQGWPPLDAALLRAADELRTDDFISDATWRVLAGRYNRQQLMDVMFAVAQPMMVAALANSMGVQPDAGLTDRLPADVAYQAPPPNVPSRHPVLTVPRLAPTTLADLSPALRTIVDPTNAGRRMTNLFATYANHETMYEPRNIQSEYIRQDTTITLRTREMVILRMSWLVRADLSWSQHVGNVRRGKLLTDEQFRGIIAGPSAPVWDPVDAALVRAADELRADDMIHDDTWNVLARHYTVPQLVDIMISAVGYRIVGMFVNNFGVQMDPGAERFPWD